MKKMKFVVAFAVIIMVFAVFYINTNIKTDSNALPMQGDEDLIIMDAPIDTQHTYTPNIPQNEDIKTDSNALPTQGDEDLIIMDAPIYTEHTYTPNVPQNENENIDAVEKIDEDSNVLSTQGGEE